MLCVVLRQGGMHLVERRAEQDLIGHPLSHAHDQDGHFVLATPYANHVRARHSRRDVTPTHEPVQRKLPLRPAQIVRQMDLVEVGVLLCDRVGLVKYPSQRVPVAQHTPADRRDQQRYSVRGIPGIIDLIIGHVGILRLMENADMRIMPYLFSNNHFSNSTRNTDNSHITADITPRWLWRSTLASAALVCA